MLTKCANPECSEQFRYLHQGKLFHLTPAPELRALSEECCGFLHERFWLCDRCSAKMTIIWDGLQAKLVSLGSPKAATVPLPNKFTGKPELEKITASELPHHQ